MDEEKKAERLKKKLGHWVEHNKGHAESFRKAAREADAIGLVGVGMHLKAAAKSMEEASALLEAAMKGLNPTTDK
jgi:hypothetical protein